MVVCHCKGVTDRAIRQAVREGAACRRSVARACAAGGRCGGCAPVIEEIIRDERVVERVAPLPKLAVAAG